MSSDRIYLNIDGEEFTSLSNFRKVYGDKADIALFQKAFGGHRQDILTRGLTNLEKTQLIAVLGKRIRDLNESHVGNNSILSHQVMRRMPFKLQKIIDKLRGIVTDTANASAAARAKLGVKVKARIRTGQYDLKKILQIAWFLAHPDAITSNAYEGWDTLLNGIDGLTLQDILTDLGSVTGKATSLLAKAASPEAAAKAIADKEAASVLADAELKKVQKRFADIIQMLKTFHFIYGTTNELTTSDKDFGRFKGVLYQKIVGYVNTSMDLVFTYYQRVFGNNFDILRTFINSKFINLIPIGTPELQDESYISNVNILLNVVDKLTNTFYKPFDTKTPIPPPGIYKLDVNTAEALRPFLSLFTADGIKSNMTDTMPVTKPFIWFLPGNKMNPIVPAEFQATVIKFITENNKPNPGLDAAAAAAAAAKMAATLAAANVASNVFTTFINDMKDTSVFLIVNKEPATPTATTPCIIYNLNLYTSKPIERITDADSIGWNSWIKAIKPDTTIADIGLTKQTFPDFNLDKYVSMPVLQLCTLFAFKNQNTKELTDQYAARAAATAATGATATAATATATATATPQRYR